MALRDRMHRSPCLARVVFNLWPCIRGTGARITHVAPDWSELRVRLPLSWRTRNYVGTIFGGSIYASVDPFLMVLLINRLGPDYVVWDKSATIRFRAPGRTTLHATFRVTDEELVAIRSDVADGGGRIDRTWTIDLADSEGVVHASVDKVLYIATREADRARRGRAGSEGAA